MSAPKFTAETRSGILGRVAAGASIPDAARAAGVRADTVREWIARGRREDLGPYSDFEAAVADARRQAQESPGQMSAAEWREHVERSVRAGSVQAMKLWADRFLVPPEELPEVPTSAITRLAQRRNPPDAVWERPRRSYLYDRPACAYPLPVRRSEWLGGVVLTVGSLFAGIVGFALRARWHANAVALLVVRCAGLHQDSYRPMISVG